MFDAFDIMLLALLAVPVTKSLHLAPTQFILPPIGGIGAGGAYNLPRVVGFIGPLLMNGGRARQLDTTLCLPAVLDDQQV